MKLKLSGSGWVSFTKEIKLFIDEWNLSEPLKRQELLLFIIIIGFVKFFFTLQYHLFITTTPHSSLLKSLSKFPQKLFFIESFVIGCSNETCRGFPSNMPAMEHIETQTKYHLIEVNLFDILVYDFLFKQKRFRSKSRWKTSPNQTFSKNQGKWANSLSNAPL